MLVASEEALLMISGMGDVLEPDDRVMAVGSGGPYALAAAKAFLSTGPMTLADVARRSLLIAAEIDIYTNDQIVLEELSW
jgi:ATP-dependent HslUV protease subunit HslV